MVWLKPMLSTLLIPGAGFGDAQACGARARGLAMSRNPPELNRPSTKAGWPRRPAVLPTVLAVVLGLAMSVVYSASTPSAFAVSTPTPKSIFDDTLTWLDSQPLNTPRGYLVGDIAHPAHRYVLDLAPLDSTIVNPPPEAGYQATSQLAGYHVVVSQDLKQAFLSPTQNFSRSTRLALGDEAVPAVNLHFLKEITTSRVVFQYSDIHDVVDFGDALMDAYHIFRAPRYLERTRVLLHGVMARLTPDGRWVRRYSNEPGSPYTGMDQGLVMALAQRFLRYTFDPTILEGLNRLTNSFDHTTEGVYNHWTNSVIGQIIASRRLGQSPLTTNAEIRSTLDVLYAKVDANGGKIPYNMKGDPSFKATYQSYDVMLLTNLSRHAPQDIGLPTIFDSAFAEAVKVNYGRYGAYNTWSLANQAERYGYVNDAFAATQEAALKHHAKVPPANADAAINRMMMASGLMRYYRTRR